MHKHGRIIKRDVLPAVTSSGKLLYRKYTPRPRSFVKWGGGGSGGGGGGEGGTGRRGLPGGTAVERR